MTNRKSRSTDTHDQGRWISSAVQEYEGALVRYATQITGDLDRGRDVVQDTFLRLCKQDLQELDGRLAQWLFAVCRNRALDIRRKEDRMKSMTQDQRSEEHTSELQSRRNLVCRLLLEKKNNVLYLTHSTLH